MKLTIPAALGLLITTGAYAADLGPERLDPAKPPVAAGNCTAYWLKGHVEMFGVPLSDVAGSVFISQAWVNGYLVEANYLTPRNLSPCAAGYNSTAAATGTQGIRILPPK